MTDSERESDTNVATAYAKGYEQGQKAVWDWFRDCTTCGEVHEFRLAKKPKKEGGSWASLVDGHPYRPRHHSAVEWRHLYEAAQVEAETPR